MVGSSGGVEVHPGHVALDVVVRLERRRAGLEEADERSVRGLLRGGAQVRGGPGERLAVGLREGHRDQPVAVAPDHREIGAERVGVAGVRGDPALELLLRQVLRVEAGARRLGRRADERTVAVEPVPGALHDPEVLARRRHQRSARALEPGGEVGDVRALLETEDLVDDLRGGDDLLERGEVLRRERREVGARLRPGRTARAGARRRRRSPDRRAPERRPQPRPGAPGASRRRSSRASRRARARPESAGTEPWSSSPAPGDHSWIRWMRPSMSAVIRRPGRAAIASSVMPRQESSGRGRSGGLVAPAPSEKRGYPSR